MTRYAAFLRAINAGRVYVKMEFLRGLAAQVPGLENVQSYINSGNLIFDAPDGSDPAALERALEERLEQGLGYATPAFLRTEDELRQAALLGVEQAPFADLARQEGALLNLSFVRSAPPQAAVERLLAGQTAQERLHVEGRHVYWLYLPGPEALAYNGATIEKTLGMAATMRSINTPRKILEKFF